MAEMGNEFQSRTALDVHTPRYTCFFVYASNRTYNVSCPDLNSAGPYTESDKASYASV